MSSILLFPLFPHWTKGKTELDLPSGTLYILK